MVVYDKFALLLTGDGEAVTERKLIQSGRDITAAVYKAGHHGSSTSSSAKFLEVVQPQFIVISAGEGNRYGHPHDAMLKRGAAIGAAILRTDELGTIEVIADGHVMWWRARR